MENGPAADEGGDDDDDQETIDIEDTVYQRSPQEDSVVCNLTRVDQFEKEEDDLEQEGGDGEDHKHLAGRSITDLLQ